MDAKTKGEMIMRFSKTSNFDKLWILSILLGACLFMTIGAYAQPQSKTEHQKPAKQAVSKGTQDFKMVADVLNAFGSGGAESPDTFCIMKVSSGGQPSAITKSQSAEAKISAGYVWSTFVLHGDANVDGIMNIGDVVYLINYIWLGGPEPIPLEAGDLNCDRVIDIEDLLYLSYYLFAGGPRPCG
jgi:hypothetical protein